MSIKKFSKYSKVEIRVNEYQKALLREISNDCGFDGNLTRLLKEALYQFIWNKYGHDLEKAKEMARAIDL